MPSHRCQVCLCREVCISYGLFGKLHVRMAGVAYIKAAEALVQVDNLSFDQVQSTVLKRYGVLLR